MKFTQIRNATIHLHYADTLFLIDPMLARQGVYPGFSGTLNSDKRYPLVELPLSLDEIIDVDAIIVTHTHPDHWDNVAIDLLSKGSPIFTQNSDDADIIKKQGFKRVETLSEPRLYQGITLTKTPGQHGSDEIVVQLAHRMGKVCGVLFQHPDEKTVYVAGDTIWNKEVQQTIATYQPDIIILNCGDAQVTGLGSIIMTAQDVYQVYQTAENATIIASHMEAVNHCALSRAELKLFVENNQIADRILIPNDGESYHF